MLAPPRTLPWEAGAMKSVDPLSPLAGHGTRCLRPGESPTKSDPTMFSISEPIRENLPDNGTLVKTDPAMFSVNKDVRESHPTNGSLVKADPTIFNISEGIMASCPTNGSPVKSDLSMLCISDAIKESHPTKGSPVKSDPAVFNKESCSINGNSVKKDPTVSSEDISNNSPISRDADLRQPRSSYFASSMTGSPVKIDSTVFSISEGIKESCPTSGMVDTDLGHPRSSYFVSSPRHFAELRSTDLRLSPTASLEEPSISPTRYLTNATGQHNVIDERNSLESLTDSEIQRGSAERVSAGSWKGAAVGVARDIPARDSGQESAASSWERWQGDAIGRLQEELSAAHRELRLRDQEVVRLTRIRGDVEAEVEDLTASLFQEAHNMVREANLNQAAAERSLRERAMQVEVLTAEVAALKALVLTSTPSRPNPHLHPQIDSRDASSTGGLFRKHRRSPSHFNLKYGRENSPPDSPDKEPRQHQVELSEESKEGFEVDPTLHKEFLSWRGAPALGRTESQFVTRLYREEIETCLAFPNAALSELVCCAVETGSIFIEALNDKSKTHFPKKCALLEVVRQCHYRMRLGDSDTWHAISQLCRNRITAVCDLLNYLRYIQRGLVKSSVHEVYWEIARLRKEIALARLGLALTS